jgi:tetratricopeptide (TPR) repeat protein
MRTNVLHDLAALVLGAALLTQVGEPGATKPTRAEIAAAIKHLASDDFQVREQATNVLWRAGNAAQSALTAVAKGRDAEAASRAKVLLEKIRLGILPDTPPETAALIQSFHKGELEAQLGVLYQLHEKKQHAAAISLLQSLADQDRRQFLVREYLVNTSHHVRELLPEEDAKSTGEFYQENGRGDEYGGTPFDYAAWLLLHRELDAALGLLRECKFKEDDEEGRVLLARLLLVHGDTQEALAVAKTTRDKRLQSDTYLRAGDWDALAKGDFARGVTDVQRRGIAAAFHRLAGQRQEFDDAIAKIVALAGQEPENAWMDSQSLLLNQCWQQTLDFYDKVELEQQAFGLRSCQMRHAEAFEKLGLPEPRGHSIEWFKTRAAKHNITSTPGIRQHILGLAVAKALYELGEHEEGLGLLAEVERYGGDGDEWRQMSVLFAHLDLGMHEEAWQRAGVLLENESRVGPILHRLLPAADGEWHEGWSTLRTEWWTILREQAPHEERAVTLERLRKLLTPSPDPNVATMAAEAAQGLEALKPPKSPSSFAPAPLGKKAAPTDEQKFYKGLSRLRGIAELLALKGDHKLAREYFAKEAALTAKIVVDATLPFSAEHPRHVKPLTRIADMFAAAGEWRSAAAAYHKAWEASKTNAAPLYLEGRSLVLAGDKQAGQKLIDRAVMLPLSHGEPRQQLAKALQERGLQREALEQWELLLRVGSETLQRGPNDWAVHEAARVVGNSVEDSDPGRAAMLWERCLVRPGGGRDAESYADIANQIHKLRAVALLEDGHTAEAEQEIELARVAMPGDTDLVERVWPKLSAANKAAAEKLFDRVYRSVQQVCQSFPNSARHHNDLARLSVRCNHHLDDALTHASEAARLAPDRLPYLATLADLHFRRGDRAKAIELAKTLLKREPQNARNCPGRS